MKVTNLADLKKEIGHLISNADEADFPQVLMFNRGIEHSQFKITIEEFEDDYFVDPKGRRWERVKEK